MVAERREQAGVARRGLDPPKGKARAVLALHRDARGTGRRDGLAEDGLRLHPSAPLHHHDANQRSGGSPRSASRRAIALRLAAAAQAHVEPDLPVFEPSAAARERLRDDRCPRRRDHGGLDRAPPPGRRAGAGRLAIAVHGCRVLWRRHVVHARHHRRYLIRIIAGAAAPTFVVRREDGWRGWLPPGVDYTERARLSVPSQLHAAGGTECSCRRFERKAACSPPTWGQHGKPDAAAGGGSASPSGRTQA